MGRKVYVKDVPIRWARLFESNRDMGPKDGSDVGDKLELIQGQYSVDLMLTPEIKKQMIADGIPNKGLQSQLFKTNNDGEEFYKAKRGHFNPKFVDQETGESGVVVGPPELLKLVDPEGPHKRENMEPWDIEEDGFIGNDSIATVKFDVWDGKITTLEAVVITEHVPYEGQQGDF